MPPCNQPCQHTCHLLYGPTEDMYVSRLPKAGEGRWEAEPGLFPTVLQPIGDRAEAGGAWQPVLGRRKMRREVIVWRGS